MSKSVAFRVWRGAAMYRFQHCQRRCRPCALSHVVHSLWRDSGEKELWNSACRHGPLTGTASTLETRTACGRLRLFPLGGENRTQNGERYFCCPAKKKMQNRAFLKFYPCGCTLYPNGDQSKQIPKI